ncbi:MAG TPA: hypothetical protein VH062_09520 [Polyangiaceae bacterium]|jgi:hypothetical protein|nr:hypothetical protein [Polyangiaceae bacterium]
MNRRAVSGLLAVSLCAATSTVGAVEPEVPHVRVRNIGLHIGGGPNDAVTKGPFLRQLAAQFDAFKLCYGQVETPAAHGTFGVDLLVPKDGGHAELSNPRTSMKGDAFRDCVVEAFKAVAFDRPKRGTTKLSYALAFDAE